MPLTSNGIYYEEHGTGSTPVVLLPGLGCSVRCWSSVVPLVSGYRFMLMDLPGHAGSQDAPVDASNLATMAAPMLDALDELRLGRYAVVGLSFGGALSVRIAVDRPLDVLAAMAFMPWNAGGTELGDPFMRQLHDSYREVEAVTRAIDFISLDPSKTTDVVETMTTAVTEQFWRGWYGGGVYTSMSDELPGMSVPTCYVLGGRDAVAPRDKLIDDVTAMPGGRLVYLAEAGHLAPYEAPELVAEEMSEFLGRHTAAAAEL